MCLLSSNNCNDKICVSEYWLLSDVNHVTSEVSGRHLSIGVLAVKNHYARAVQTHQAMRMSLSHQLIDISKINQRKQKCPPIPV
jgi:hypothetical protein